MRRTVRAMSKAASFTLSARAAPASLVLLVLGADGMASADTGAAWHSSGSSRGVQVDRRDVIGSRYEELRLSTVSTLGVDRLCDAIFPKVLPAKPEARFKKQELLRETGTERWTYEQISVPVVSDRDYVMHVKLDVPASSGHCAISFGTVENAARPPVSGFVRIPVIRGHWDVFPLPDGKVSVQYEIFSDPGGGVPAFIARGGQRDAAVDFMKIILARASEAPASSEVAATTAAP